MSNETLPINKVFAREKNILYIFILNKFKSIFYNVDKKIKLLLPLKIKKNKQQFILN